MAYEMAVARGNAVSSIQLMRVAVCQLVSKLVIAQR